MKKWKKFEDESHRIIQQLNPKSVAYKDVYLEGKLSEVKRQVDVQLVDPSNYDFIAFECKDYKRAVDVEKVEALNTKLIDIGASKGAIVSNSPFSKATQNMAAKLKIDLLNLVNVTDPNIKTRIRMPALIIDTSVESFRLRIGTSSPTSDSFSTDPAILELMDEDGNRATAAIIFKKLWNDNLAMIVKNAGTYEYTVPPSGKKMIGQTGDMVDLNQLSFLYSVEKKFYKGDVNIIKAEGLYNVKDKSFSTKEIITEDIVPSEVEKIWQELTSEDSANAKISFRMEIASLFS